jgi:hypothetical protein
MRRGRLAATVFGVLVALSVVVADGAQGGASLYNAYACTLQGTTGLTYIVEGAGYPNTHGACLAFKKALDQRELRFGLHPPSFSSDESWKATWINRKLRLKLNMLARPVPAVPQLIKAVSGILGRGWQRSGMSYP